MGFFYRNRSCLWLNSIKQITQSMFPSVLHYGDIIYMDTAATSLKPLDAVYHNALHFITGDKFSTNHCILHQQVGWPHFDFNDTFKVDKQVNEGPKNWSSIVKVNATQITSVNIYRKTVVLQYCMWTMVYSSPYHSLDCLWSVGHSGSTTWLRSLNCCWENRSPQPYLHSICKYILCAEVYLCL